MKQIFLCLTGMVLWASCSQDQLPNTPIDSGVDCATVSYSAVIAPLFTRSCNTSGCHDAGSPDGDFTTYSRLQRYINNGTIRQEVLVAQTMPIDERLTSVELGQIQCWLDAGGPNN